MTEETPKLIEEIILGYEKYLAIRLSMSTANNKYRNTEYGKEQTRKQHRIWVNNHKDDEEYRNHMNMKQRERYQKRKIAKELLNKDISIGEIIE